jgi:hypothetical protein
MIFGAFSIVPALASKNKMPPARPVHTPVAIIRARTCGGRQETSRRGKREKDGFQLSKMFRHCSLALPYKL